MWEIHCPDNNNCDVMERFTDSDILDCYWDYWEDKMSRKFGKDSLHITSKNCIDDWVVVHWAVRVFNWDVE